MRHLHIWLMIAIMIACFVWMVLAAMLIGKPGGDGDVNAIAIALMLASMIICGLEEDWLKNEDKR